MTVTWYLVKESTFTNLIVRFHGDVLAANRHVAPLNLHNMICEAGRKVSLQYFPSCLFYCILVYLVIWFPHLKCKCLQSKNFVSPDFVFKALWSSTVRNCVALRQGVGKTRVRV